MSGIAVLSHAQVAQFNLPHLVRTMAVPSNVLTPVRESRET